MNILNFIKFENYYCQISTSFQLKLASLTKDYAKIARQINISRATLQRITAVENYWMNIQSLLIFCKTLEISREEALFSVRRIKTKNSFPILFSMKSLISPSFFRIIGHLLGDGGIYMIEKECKYRAFYVNNEQILLNSFEKDVKMVFGDVKIYFRRREARGDEIWLPTTIGYLMYCFLEKKIKKNKRVPSIIIDSDNLNNICVFLQALYDDEGFLYPEKRMIVISLANKVLLNDLRKLIIKVGISPNSILIHSSDTRTTMFYFSITGKDNILKFHDKIGFLHPVKKEKLHRLISKYR